MDPEIKLNDNTEIEPNAEMMAHELESSLYEVQEKLKQILETAAKSTNMEGVAELEAKQKKLIKLISLKASRMAKEEHHADLLASMQFAIAKEFDQIIDKIGDDPEKEAKIKAAVETWINYLKQRVVAFSDDIKPEKIGIGIETDGATDKFDDFEPFDQRTLEQILADLSNSGTTDRNEFITKLGSALKPMAEYQIKHPQAAERANRKSFLRSSINKEPFTAIKGTDSILSYGIGGRNGDSVHLHLAPMKTLEDKNGFMLHEVPAAFDKLIEVIMDDDKIKAVTATSYVVASMPSLFKKYGFELEALSPEARGYSWGNEDRPILRAFMSKEKFLQRPWDKDKNISNK